MFLTAEILIYYRIAGKLGRELKFGSLFLNVWYTQAPMGHRQ